VHRAVRWKSFTSGSITTQQIKECDRGAFEDIIFSAGVGFALKKLMKLAAIVLGLFVVGLAYLSCRGWIDVKWIAIENTTKSSVVFGLWLLYKFLKLRPYNTLSLCVNDHKYTMFYHCINMKILNASPVFGTQLTEDETRNFLGNSKLNIPYRHNRQ
jgi:uncharacterized membrane protein (Fun14 family)